MIEERVGLDLSRRDQPWLSGRLWELSKAAGFAHPSEYLDSLQRAPIEADLWALPLERLTVSETYFFRDRGQMELLRKEILPGLIARSGGRPLRIWSAGCSTGEELYSVAILLDELSAEAELLGTDINPAALEVARRGVYGKRSLRGFDGGLPQRGLFPVPAGVEVSAHLRSRTRFVMHNLWDAAPFGQFDLIICRNVVIYFPREKLSRVLGSLFQSLHSGGVLLTGHGELVAVDHPFVAHHYPESTVYRRADLSLIWPAAEAAPADEPRPLRLLELDSDVELQSAPPQVSALCRQGRAARLSGDRDRARELFRQALYLDPDSVPVFLEKSLLAFEEDPDRARKDFATAMDLLASMPAQRRLEEDVALPLAELESWRF